MRANIGPLGVTALFRFVFAAVLAVSGFLLGRDLVVRMLSLHVTNQNLLIGLTIAMPILGAVIGVVIAPTVEVLFEAELARTEAFLERLAPSQIAGGALGLIAALTVAWLLKNIAFELVRDWSGPGLEIATAGYIIVVIALAYLGVRVGAKQSLAQLSAVRGGAESATVPKIIDTSVIIDGRIVEIVESGFIEGALVVPRFVLAELQLIADSIDGLKRTRGRRGLEVLGKLQEIATVELDERDYPGVIGVDAKLVKLAKERNGKLVTNDYNLNRVAHVDGVFVLNINELAGAVRPVVLPGEELHVSIVREGKEPHQGVGYLDDGTMIVVENGRRMIGEEGDVVVTSVLQTVAGRMIFAKLKRAGVAS